MIEIESEKLQYPIIIEVPENYWTYSSNVTNISEENDKE